MRRSSGEKTDSKAELLKNSLILFSLFLSSHSFSQVPINGFCSQKNYAIPSGYEGMVSADLNSDGNDELIFYSSSNKKIGIYYNVFGDSTSTIEIQVDAEISQLRQLKNKSDTANLFAAVDRKHRKIFLLKISLDQIEILNDQMEFDSYPENIFTGDVELNGKDEILVYGSGFDGLSIISQTTEGIGERKVATGTSFSEAIFVDFNDDGYLDVVGFNILENSLQFFTNNTNGVFRLNRSIQHSEKINLLKARDFNNDGLFDLIYSSGNNLEILFADFQRTFKTKKTIKLDERPVGLTFGDFNKDKFLDIAYTLAKGTLNILYAKKDSDFYESITYLQCATYASIAKYKSDGNDNLVCFLDPNEIGIVTTVQEIKNGLKIIPAINAGALKKFDYGNDNISDISFVDEYDSYLKLFLLNKFGVPISLYYFPLAESHKEIIVDDFYKQIKTFYCYIEGTPLLEVFKYNFKNNKLSRKQLYAPGEILDLNLQRVDSALVNVLLVYNKQSKLHLGKFENRELSITFKEYPFIDRNVSLAKIRIKDEPEVFYWKSERDTIYFKMVDIEPGPNIYKTYFTIPKSDKLSINLYGANIYYENYPTVVSFVQNESEKYILAFSGNKLFKTKKFFNSPNDAWKEFGRGRFSDIIMKGIINFSIKTQEDDYINTLIYNEKEKNYILNSTIKADNAYDYFFLRPDQKKYYLVYSNEEGELLIKSIIK